MRKELKHAKLVAQTKWHPEILNILFENRRHVATVFQDIKGLLEISHIAVTIINPSHEMVAFSATPNIEYNLVNENLWRSDPGFSLPLNEKDSLIWWDATIENLILERIDKIKLKNNQFTLGMSIARQMDKFCLLYTFATRCVNKDLKEYYLSNTAGLINLGDYFYKSMRDIYSSYYATLTPPEMKNLTLRIPAMHKKPYLKLIVNNHT